MGEMKELEVLSLVKSYPLPSQSLGEAVCVIGAHKELGLVRIYPVPFRQLQDEKQFGKYQIIKLQVRKPKNDPRPNTFRPQLETIEVTNPRLSTDDYWCARKTWVMPFLSDSMCQIQAEQTNSGQSMGFFKPTQVLDIVQEETNAKWTPKDLAKLDKGQQDFFLTQQNKLLEKIPYTWKYVYKCADAHCNGHTQTIIDWEINAFYLKQIKRKGIADPEEVHETVKQKFLHELCGPAKDTYFFTGNMLKHPVTFLILGIFWPPVDTQGKLF